MHGAINGINFALAKLGIPNLSRSSIAEGVPLLLLARFSLAP